jgi:hypothetical protein
VVSKTTGRGFESCCPCCDLCLNRAGLTPPRGSNRPDLHYPVHYPAQASDSFRLPPFIPPERLVYSPRRLLLVSLQDVAVGSEGQGGGAVPQSILNDFHSCTARKHQGSGPVAQAVKRDFGHLHLPNEVVEPVSQCVRAQRGSVLIGNIVRG